MTRQQYEIADAEHIARTKKHYDRIKGFYKKSPDPPGIDEFLFGARLRVFWGSVKHGLDAEIARHRYGLADDFATVAEIPTMEEYLTASEWLDS